MKIAFHKSSASLPLCALCPDPLSSKTFGPTKTDMGRFWSGMTWIILKMSETRLVSIFLFLLGLHTGPVLGCIPVVRKFCIRGVNKSTSG
jgi:hypothetical protein